MAGIDAKGLALFYDIVTSLKKTKDVTILLVTHDLMGVAPYADRMILINNSISFS